MAGPESWSENVGKRLLCLKLILCLLYDDMQSAATGVGTDKLRETYGLP